ncbi:MAG: FKBP-type peptidyl-prolyl cis-trans isomerase [Fimbriiglobus sp.]|nr:FKBP-type peptidyl-prolyl cis-trans isomerase [Fimbriiglobus sp.]
MEREQILKVMVPVGAFALLLLLVGAVIALNAGGAPPSSAAAPAANPSPDGPPPTGGTAQLGSVPLDNVGMTRELPPLNAAEWKDAGLPAVPGLKVWDVVAGTEDITAVMSDKVMVHYTGWRTDGVSFDSSSKHGRPIDFPLSGVIKGWTYGIPGMKVGGIRRLYIPAQHAYGASPPPGANIPPNADLVFEVKLLRVIRAK